MTASDQELPQPHHGNSFEYITFESLSERCFSGPLQKDELVWVLKSKGKRHKNCTTRDDHHDDDQLTPNDDENEQIDDDISKDHVDTTSRDSAQKLELFLRARIIEDDYDPAASRIGVRYPKGSTYKVARDHLIRALDHQFKGIVLVLPETPIYRRACVVHTLPDEVFLEIGSAYGSTVERVHQTSVARAIGIDKSEYINTIARERYPHLLFVLWDILKQPEQMPEELRDVAVNVLAIDINGSRELEAVLQCLQIAFDLWQPRLIIVKSRTLHQRLLPSDA